MGISNQILINENFRVVDEYLRPVHLTEEILLNCPKSFEVLFDEVVIYKLGYFDAYCQHGRVCIAYDRWVLDHIKSLHQFQNLYFDFIGKELEVCILH